MDEVIQGVIDTIDAATQYRIQLTELLESVNESKSQVSKSAMKSKQELDAHFSKLKQEFNAALEARRQELEEEVNEIEEDSLEPLARSEDLIKQGIRDSKSVMDEGRQLLSGDHEAESEKMNQFKNRVNEKGLDRLPEIPQLSDVPCIHIDLPETQEKEKIFKYMRKHGKVLWRAPVQITDIQQRPGALMVKWTEVEEEHWLDLNEYRLQYCHGLLNESDPSQVFHTAYQGANTCHVVRHLHPSESYTFMVCGRAEGADTWSPWSVPKTAVTTMSHYQWQSNQPGYIVSNEQQTACKCVTDGGDILYSTANSYVCGHTIVFRLLDTGIEGDGMDGVALSASNDHPQNLLRPDTIFVSCQGDVYIDGKEKTTKLPALTRGSVLTFETVVLQPNKIRVTIEVNEKVVTFDWLPHNTRKSTAESPVTLGAAPFAGDEGKPEEKCLFFAMKFKNKDWKISVE